MIRNAILLTAALAIFASCSLVTPPPDDRLRPVGNDLVINEVFTLPPDRYYAFSWIELYNPTERTIPWFDETFPASLNAVGPSTFIQTEDDGVSWTAPSTVPSLTFNAVDFPYPDTGYVVGDSIQRVIRVAGQYTFVPVESAPIPPGVRLNSVTAIPLTVTGFAAGERGTVLRTTTRGRTWVSQDSKTTKNINSIKMATVSRIYACGDSGLILRSISSGNWTALTVGAAYTTTKFTSIGLAGSLGDTAWVMGEGGTILLSRNVNTASPTWFAEVCSTTNTFRGSYFHQGTMLAWAVGDNGTIAHKDTTGKPWKIQNSGTTENLIAVAFIDEDRGWVTGENGTILTTTNGGRRWTRLTSGVTTPIRSIFTLPLNIRVLNRYVLMMYGQRKEFFFDPTTGTINFDYIVRKDTGYLYFDPEILVQEAGAAPPDDIPPNGFVIINSDSGRFKEHTSIGPGRTDILNFSIGFYYDSTSQFGVRPVLWDLLQSGEVRLVQQSFRVRTFPPFDFLGLTTRTVDVVRWGGFVPTLAQLPIDIVYTEPDPALVFPTNQPAGIIPEWWSLARYGDDVGMPIDQQSTGSSFYMSNQPIPGYYSQIKKQN